MNYDHAIRYLFMFICWVGVIHVVLFLTAYWQVMRPVQQARKDGVELIAPPFFWTFKYHFDVGGLLATLSIGSLIALERGTPILPTTYVVMFWVVMLTWDINRFWTSYRNTLLDLVPRSGNVHTTDKRG